MIHIDQAVAKWHHGTLISNDSMVIQIQKCGGKNYFSLYVVV